VVSKKTLSSTCFVSFRFSANEKILTLDRVRSSLASLSKNGISQAHGGIRKPNH
jgi:hypothetical protein